MKRLLGVFLTLVLILTMMPGYLVFSDANDYQPIAVSGFNADLIAENTNGASAETATTTSFDGLHSWSNNVMYSVDFRGPKNTGSPPPYGLPSNGQIISSQNAGVTYQLAPYNGNNALLLINNNDIGVVTLQTSGAYEKIIILASSAEGQSTFDVTLHFSDETSVDSTFTAPDWYDGPGYAIQGIGRVTRNGQFFATSGQPADEDGAFSGNGSNPRLYDCFIDNTANKTKVLTHIRVRKTSDTGRTAILGISGQKNPAAPSAPVANDSTHPAVSSFDANWGSVVGADAYALDVATDIGFANMVSGYNNLNVGNVVTYSIQGLTGGTTYYSRVRAVNASGASFSSNVISTTLIAQSDDATLKATTKIKGVVVTDFGTPAVTIAGVTAGSVTLTAMQGADTSNTDGYLTAFLANDDAAVINRIVKYASGADSVGFATDTAYDGSAAVANGDFFVVQILAEDGSGLFHVITATVNAPSSSDAALASVLGQTFVTGPEAGTIPAPKSAGIHVPYGTSSITASDIIKQDAGATIFFYGLDSSYATLDSGSIELSAGSQTNIYVMVEAEDSTIVCYRITINRAAAPSGGGGGGNDTTGTLDPTPQPIPEPTPEPTPATMDTTGVVPETTASTENIGQVGENAKEVPDETASSGEKDPRETEPFVDEPSRERDGSEKTRDEPTGQTRSDEGNTGQDTDMMGPADIDESMNDAAAVNDTADTDEAGNDVSGEPFTDEGAGIEERSDSVENDPADMQGDPLASEDPIRSQPSGLAGGASGVLGDIFHGKTPAGPIMDLRLDIAIGTKVSDKEATVSARGLRPFSEVTLTLYSKPRVLGNAIADANGTVSIKAVFPNGLPDGPHTIVADGMGPDGQPIQAISAFELDKTGNVIAFAPPSQILAPIVQGDPRLLRALEANKPLYDAQRYPGTIVSLIVIFAGLGGMAAIGGMKKPGMVGNRGKTSGSASGSVTAGDTAGEEGELIEAAGIVVEEREEDLGQKPMRWGDRSILWKVPGTARTDQWSARVIDFFAGISLLLHRLVSDGSWARAMFGSGGFLLWVLGVFLGLFSAFQTDCMALPPTFPMVAMMVVLGILDGAAGAIAWLILAAAALFTGHVVVWDDVRTLAGMAALFTSMMYLVGMRPVRRKIEDRRKYLFDRILDYIMPAVILSIAATAMLEAINGLSGLELFTEDHGLQIKFVAIAALWLRLVMEDATTFLFPIRCEKVRSESTREQSRLFQWGAILAYEGMFVLISGPFFGFSFALVCIMAMDTIPWMLSFAADRFPNSKFLFKWYPGSTSIHMLTVLTILNLMLSAWLIHENTDYQQICRAFVFLLIPYTLAEIPGLFGRDGDKLPDSWLNRIVETGVWVFFSLIVLEIVQLV